MGEGEVGEEGQQEVLAVMMLELEIVWCLMKVRGRSILVLMRFHQFCPSSLIGNMRRVKRNREEGGKRRVC